ncbi:MAG: polysaccharide pyruvyl transferase family protein [Gammaproteobacteria bacterium]
MNAVASSRSRSPAELAPAQLDLAIAAVPYSSNLGDGIIHDIMMRVVRDDGAPVSVATLDLAGRSRYAGLDAGERSRRKNSLRLINALPVFMRGGVVFAYALLLYWRKTRSAHAAALRDADHVIIGGGHLFSDFDLNFPAKLYCLYLSLKRFDVPFSVYGIGASDNWSPLGRHLLRKLLRSPLLRGVTVRDGYSREVVARELDAVGRSVEVGEVWDPAVATALYHDAVQMRAQDTTRHVGVNVADLKLLSGAGDRGTGIDEGREFFRLLVAGLHAQGHRVTLFTNGAEEDESFLDRLCAVQGLQAERAPRPLTPGDLIDLIRRFDAVISHRLHAHIVSFSYAIPSIGLGWDTKVASFFQRAGRRQFLVDPAKGTALDATVARVLAALADAQPPDPGFARAAAIEARTQLQQFLRTVVNHEDPARR